jgi:hypothetical protein
LALSHYYLYTYFKSFQAVTKLSGRSDLETEKQLQLKRHDGDLLGAELEEEVLVLLRSALEGHQVKDTVMITGWKDDGYKKRKTI